MGHTCPAKIRITSLCESQNEGKIKLSIFGDASPHDHISDHRCARNTRSRRNKRAKEHTFPDAKEPENTQKTQKQNSRFFGTTRPLVRDQSLGPKRAIRISGSLFLHIGVLGEPAASWARSAVKSAAGLPDEVGRPLVRDQSLGPKSP